MSKLDKEGNGETDSTSENQEQIQVTPSEESDSGEKTSHENDEEDSNENSEDSSEEDEDEDDSDDSSEDEYDVKNKEDDTVSTTPEDSVARKEETKKVANNASEKEKPITAASETTTTIETGKATEGEIITTESKTSEAVTKAVKNVKTIVEESNITKEVPEKEVNSIPDKVDDKKHSINDESAKVNEKNDKESDKDLVKQHLSVTNRSIDYRTTLVEFYKIHNPEKMKNVDSLLEKCKGKEDELLEKIQKSYKVEGQLPTLTYIINDKPLKEAPREASYRDTLVEFYSKFNREKLKDVDMILKKYEGKEGKLFDLLEKSYGASPTNIRNSRTSKMAPHHQVRISNKTTVQNLAPVPEMGSLKENPHRAKLVEFYFQHNPKKVEEVDMILKKYDGKETKLFRLLEKAYNVSLLSSDIAIEHQQSAGSKTVSDETYRASLLEFYREYKPEKVDEVDNILIKYKGKIENLFTRVDAEENMSGEGLDTIISHDSPVLPECSPEQLEVFRTRLTTFYRVHNPEKIKNVDKLLEKFRGKEVELFKRIEDAYGVQKPLLPGVTSSNPTPAAPAPLQHPMKSNNQFQYQPTSSNLAAQAKDDFVTLQNRNRLIEVFTEHKPEKLRDVDVIMDKYKGKMDELFRRIEEQYKNQSQSTLQSEKKMDPEEKEIYHESLKEFYKEFNPDKTTDVDYLLEFYQGREDILFRRIKFAYNINPFRPHLVSFYTLHNPEKLKNVDILLEKYEGREVQLIKLVKETYKKRETAAPNNEGKAEEQKEEPSLVPGKLSAGSSIGLKQAPPAAAIEAV